MKNIKIITTKVTLSLTIIFSLVLFFAPVTSTKVMPVSSLAFGASENSIFKCGGRDLAQGEGPAKGDLICVVRSAIDLILKVGGSIIMLMIMISGIFYILSQGDPNQTAMAKKTLVGSVIGLIIVILSYTMVMIVIGFFQS